jgi:hypothetical protein
MVLAGLIARAAAPDTIPPGGVSAGE